MITIYVFYADVFWFNQFFLHTAILMLSRQFHGNPCIRYKYSKSATIKLPHPAASFAHRNCKHTAASNFIGLFPCICASALGSTLGTAVLLFTHSYYGFLIAEYLAILPLMTFMAFGKSNWIVFLKRYISCFGTAILLGGLVNALESVGKIAQIPFLSALIAFMIVGKWIRLLIRHKQIQSLLIPVIIKHRGKLTRLTGLIDTGNLLFEPYGGRAVYLLKASKSMECGICESDFIGFAPYRSVGCNEDLLEIYRADELQISGSDTPYSSLRISPVTIAKAPDDLFCNTEYDVILHSEITANMAADNSLRVSKDMNSGIL